ncbi:hypothetical protein TYRP_020214 [Tyrophagus putrescentiae]|nr:hypothetical protein TYRP_020214 [Tyrophagus putrescentiae]
MKDCSSKEPVRFHTLTAMLRGRTSPPAVWKFSAPTNTIHSASPLPHLDGHVFWPYLTGCSVEVKILTVYITVKFNLINVRRELLLNVAKCSSPLTASYSEENTVICGAHISPVHPIRPDLLRISLLRQLNVDETKRNPSSFPHLDGHISWSYLTGCSVKIKKMSVSCIITVKIISSLNISRPAPIS